MKPLTVYLSSGRKVGPLYFLFLEALKEKRADQYVSTSISKTVGDLVRVCNELSTFNSTPSPKTLL